MWCPACRADVAAELSSDSRHFRCARCSTELGTAIGSLGAALPAPISPTDAERNARELLARWSAQNSMTPPATARSNADAVESAAMPKSTRQEPSQPAPRRTDDPPAPLRKSRRIDRSEFRNRSIEQTSGVIAPMPAAKPPGWGATVGQMCAYFGIGLITCGTSVVLWGYFGGPANYAPTGWLITTIGQMFLFLGVVTLISSGMEQTAAEVAERIEVLGQRLIRIESHQRESILAGPHQRRGKRRRGPSSSSTDDGLAAEPG